LCPRLPGDSDFVIRSDVRLVLLDVSVKDREGGFTAGLSKDNFRVEENGDRQPITVFANNDIPVTVGILVDNSRSMAPKRAEVLSAATAFIEGSNPQDEIFVLNFNDTVRRGLPGSMLFSDDVTQLRAALSRGTPEGRTALNDAIVDIVDGLQQLGHGKRDKKTLVIISDGGDNASHRTRDARCGTRWSATSRLSIPSLSLTRTIPTAIPPCSAGLPELPAGNLISPRARKA
jgi:Ca-activated chloride channel family protein